MKSKNVCIHQKNTYYNHLNYLNFKSNHKIERCFSKSPSNFFLFYNVKRRTWYENDDDFTISLLMKKFIN